MYRPFVLGAALVLAGTTAMGASAASPSSVPSPGAIGAPSGAAAAAFPDLDAIFAPTEPPIDLVVSHAEADRVEADVPLEGGVVEAIGADGTRYTLTIPADALIEATRIGMAPLATVEGLSVGGEVTYGVQLAPDGLVLLTPANLRIEPAVPLAPAEQVPFGYDHDGTGMFIAEPVVDSAAIDIVVSHFSGYGVTKGLLADTGPIRERLGGSAELNGLMSAGSRVCIKEEYEICRDQHVIHRMISVILGFERQRQLLGITDPAAKQEEGDDAKRCLTFRVDFESNVTVKDRGVSPRAVGPGEGQADL